MTLTSTASERTAEATGNGPVNALFAAVDEALQPVLGWHPTLTEYEIKAVSAGEDAQGQVLVRCRRSSDEGPGALVVSGHGLSTNIIEASLEAYLVAINKLHGAEINGVDGGVRRRRGPTRACHEPDGRPPTGSSRSRATGSGRRSSTAARRVARRRRPRVRVRGRLDRDPRRRRGHRRVRRRDPARGRGRLRRGRRDPARRGRWPEVVRPGAPVRPEQALFALRGGLGLFANLRPVTRPSGTRRRRRRSGRSCSRASTC